MHGGGFDSSTRPGAIWNVVICGILCVGAFVFAVVNADRGPGYVAISIAVGVVSLALEVVFIRKLLAHLRS